MSEPDQSTLLARSSPVAPPCPACRAVHGSDAAVAVGRFDPAGVHGYRSRLGGPLRATRAKAVADFCAVKVGGHRG